MSYEPLHHKYRPQTFAQLVGQEAIAATLINAMESDRIAPAYLFTGPRGTGKTSSARILAKSLNCLTSDRPVATPCGKCQVCREITQGSALDVVEIDAASNTGVDNIRETIERAQFAPVRCRYKVYVIDECLTGDSLIFTADGLARIDDPKLEGKQVLSYNEQTETWEFKPVVRWLDRGEKETLVLKTRTRELRCTGNHLIRTETGWIAARDLQVGTKILSPAPTLARGYFLQGLWQLARLVGYQLLRLPDRRQNLPTFEELNDQLLTADPQWKTRLEPVEAIASAGTERVYDLEVADNHNFVANGLLVHNCHMLSVPAFNALLKTLEEPPDRVIFVLATTDPQRVLTTIISRCQRFDFRRIPLKAMAAHLKTIASQEGIEIEDEAITLVAQIANGGLRDAESSLDQLSLLSGTITVERIWELVGAVPEQDLLTLLRAIAAEDAETIIDRCRHLMDKGREPLAVLQSLAGFYLNLLIAKTSPQRNDLVSVTAPTWEQLRQDAPRWQMPLILRGQQHLKDSEAQIKNSTQPRLWLEVTLLGLFPSALTPQQSISQPNVPAVPLSGQPNNRSTSSVSEPTNGKAASRASEARDSIFPENGKGSDREQLPASTNGKVASARDASTPTVRETTEVQRDRSALEGRDRSALEGRDREPANTLPPQSASSTEKSPEELQQERVQQIWQRVLEVIQPNATRTLVKDHCQLSDFDVEDSIAYVGVASNGLLKIAQGKLANIEAAFEQVWQQKVKVNLQVGTAPKPQTSPTRQPQRETSPEQPANPTPVPEPATIPQKTAPISREVKPEPSPAPTEVKPAIVSQPPTDPNGDRASSLPAIIAVEPPANLQEDAASDSEVQQAARDLAQLFEGEIIALERDFLVSASPQPTSSIASETEELALESVRESIEDEDIPFAYSLDLRTVSFGLLDPYEIEIQCPQVRVTHNFKFMLSHLRF
jgi:DNA polymerase III subunit gamma/tau